MAARNAELNGSTIAHDQTPEPRDPGDPTAHAFPIPAWDRYANVRFLGQGGMGKVYLAHDPRLRRNVAIKFVHGNTPDDIRRLIAEARAQAQVSHERVCKVHEVGEVGGKVYISMQYIDGRPLSELVDELTTDQKAMVVREAAEGIHEAHRAGVIHRDIKPSNILVERGDDGKLRPYVMDFGLARSIHDDGGTLSGTVLGTPRYMAPEQARGEVGTLDRRADVYSLGATLYYLVTGKPPVHGSGAMEVLHNLMTAEPVRPRSLQRDLSPDLEAIILKCLETDRTRRYDSARAVADDLGRFLDGEPVEARVAGPWYRLRKQLAKHRRLVAVSAVALGLAVAGLAWGLQSSREAATRERLAREFTERVERIEAMARYSALSPRHDIRGDQVAIRTLMAELQRDIQGAGAIAAAPGHYALGRGYLALDDDARAREHLEAAWQSGFREPRVAYALALVMGRLYQQAVVSADRIEQPSQRDLKKREAAQHYRDPAIGYLTASRGAEAPSADYAAALLAFYAGKFDDALHHLDAISSLPWFYEAPELRGAIYAMRARISSDHGDPDAARADFEASRRAYENAATVGESAPSIYHSLGELELSALTMGLYGEGDVAGAFDRGLAATTRALATLPEHYESLVLQATIRDALAESDANHGRKVDDLLARARDDAQRAITIAPSRPQARLELARIYRQWGESRQTHSQDPTEQLRKAIQSAEAIAPADRDAIYFSNLGLILKVWADYEDEAGANSARERDGAIEAFGHALRLDDQLNMAQINLGISYFMRASQPRTPTRDDDLRMAIAKFNGAKATNAKHIVPYFYLGKIHALVANFTRARGGDPDPDLRQALEAYQQGLAIRPTMPQLHNGYGIVRVGQAEYAWMSGHPPEPFLDQALAAFENAIDAAPDQGFGYGNAGYVFLLRGSFQRASGHDPRANIEQAINKLQQALERTPDRAQLSADLAMAYVTLAEYEQDHDRDSTKTLTAGAMVLERALVNGAKDAQVQNALGETRALVAHLHALQHRGRADDFVTAAQALQLAVELDPGNQSYQIAVARFCAKWAEFLRHSGSDPAPALAQGFDLVDKLLSLRPRWPEVLTVRAKLDLAAAQNTPDRVERHRHGTRAATDLALALEINPRLAAVWWRPLALAQQVASAP